MTYIGALCLCWFTGFAFRLAWTAFQRMANF